MSQSNPPKAPAVSEILLRDPRVLMRSLTRSLIPVSILLVFPIYKLLRQLGPPFRDDSVTAAGFLALIIPAAFAFTFWTSLDKRSLRKRMVLGIILLTIGFATYLFLSSSFIYPIYDSKVIGGFVLKPSASEFIKNNPTIPMQDVIKSFGLNTQQIWEPWSISVIGVTLYLSWILSCASLSVLVAALALSLPRQQLRSFFLTSAAHENKELERVIRRVEKEPEKAKPAWDLARVKLELYFDRNLSQINYIFWLSVLVMAAGFGFILYGIRSAFVSGQTSAITPAVISGFAGVITEFIGATFLFLYRSTIQQAAGYTQTLERINSVGMAMQILDSISSESKELQDTTKAEIVKLLLLHPSGLIEKADIDKATVNSRNRG
jgi:hypothetical protein